MLTGEAKRNYQRLYMRRRRARLPTKAPKAPKEWEPSQRVIDDITRWISRPRWRLRGLGAQVLEGFTFEPDQNGKIHLSDDVWEKLCRRYEALVDERRAVRETEKEEAAKPKPKRCLFCSKPASPDLILVGDGGRSICEMCVTECVARRTVCARRRSERFLRLSAGSVRAAVSPPRDPQLLQNRSTLAWTPVPVPPPRRGSRRRPRIAAEAPQIEMPEARRAA
jgi:hypothetical protein